MTVGVFSRIANAVTQIVRGSAPSSLQIDAFDVVRELGHEAKLSAARDLREKSENFVVSVSRDSLLPFGNRNG